MGNINPTGIIDKSGDLPIEDRIGDLKYAELFIAVSSGLSWLAWAVDIPVVLIHGHNYSWYNFADKTKHINLENDDNVCTGCWHTDGFSPCDWNFCPKQKGTDREFECTKKITPEMVIEGIKVMLNKKLKLGNKIKNVTNLTVDVTEVGKLWFYNDSKSEFIIRVVDPYSNLTLYTSKITFDEAITKKLRVMDATAFSLCRDQNLPIQVLNIFKPGALLSAVLGRNEGTIVTN